MLTNANWHYVVLEITNSRSSSTHINVILTNTSGWEWNYELNPARRKTPLRISDVKFAWWIFNVLAKWQSW